MIALNTSWNLVNFRSGLISALVSNGYEVVAVASYDKYSPQLPALGCRYIPLHIDKSGTNPWRDLILLWRFYRLMCKERPDIFLGYTIKPNIYGSLAARAKAIPVINNITGLGSIFAKNNWLIYMVKWLYRIALARSSKVFFQNENDCNFFIEENLVVESSSDQLPGSGVDLEKFYPAPLPSGPKTRFLLIARMLWDKGIAEFIEAARIMRQRGFNAEYILQGSLDEENPNGIPKTQMDEWASEGTIHYLGFSDNIYEEIKKSDCVVLPSFYGEGTPRALLEAAAMARPIITTDSVGCRDVVDNGVNGFLCKPKDVLSLAEMMEKFFAMSYKNRQEMGLRSREKVEREFDEKIVINKYLHAILIATNVGKTR